MNGYHLQAVDGEIGHISDFLVNATLTDIQYLVVDTRNWLPGKKVVLPPAFIHGIQWDESKVHVTLTEEQIKNAPEYEEDNGPGITADFALQLRNYYEVLKE